VAARGTLNGGSSDSLLGASRLVNYRNAERNCRKGQLSGIALCLASAAGDLVDDE